ncbi:hypothetical protein Micbo1qcDRAFT_165627 [Microdochium bolleyi]|uniref:Pre-mRNA-splicing factor 38B n=1 Tax=Microdochium bolleyi TaxID=196109 RepID=A0A136IX90_9PEZI|nr:hypothetical protein Micbo1qcDRAFT_165627 [Microdochium bolleyi]
MPEKEYPLLTDEYVAGLMSQEASDCSTKYSALGLDAYKSNKRPQNQPKPNTRFLNNIMRDTNSHNRALLAKESAESQARLRELEQAEQEKKREQERAQRRTRPGPADTRKRILGDIAAFIDPASRSGPRSTKRRRDGEDEAGAEERRDRHKARDRSPRRSSGRSVRDAESSKRSSRDKNKDLFDDASGTTPQSDGRLRANKSREEHESDSRRRKYRDRDDEKPERHHHRRSRHERDRQRHHQRRSRSRSRDKHGRSPPARSSRRRESSVKSDSDPVDDLIGPAPPQKEAHVRSRGRGAHATSSGIDDRFAADYDPALDIGPEPTLDTNGEDWESTVEAYRDRQKWRKQGAERLRGAGFTEDQIKKWETGDKHDETDVQWTKHGAVREWDRGKVVDTEGDTFLKAEWGRLKGT